MKKVVWDRPEFADVECAEDNEYADKKAVGTHSRRKYAADFAANCGIDEGEIKIRAHCKQN